MTMPICKILYICVYAVSIIIYTIIYTAKSHSKTKKYKSTLDFMKKVQEQMEIAETHKNWTGEEKKDFVISTLTPALKDVGITEEQLINMIEYYIYFSKIINYREYNLNDNS